MLGSDCEKPRQSQETVNTTTNSSVVVENIQILSRIMERRCHQIKRRKAVFVLLLCSICIRIDASDAVKIKKGGSFLLACGFPRIAYSKHLLNQIRSLRLHEHVLDGPKVIY